MQVAPDVARLHPPVVAVERSRRSGVAARLQHLVHRLGREHPGSHRVVDALQLGHVHEARRVARDERPRHRDAIRDGEEPTLGDRLAPQASRSPPSSSSRIIGWVLNCWSRSCTESEASWCSSPTTSPIVEPVVAHRVDEAAAGLAVLPRPAQRPSEGVDHPVERAGDLPHLLDAQAPDLRVHGAQAELLGQSAREVPLRALAQHRRAGPDLDPGLVRRRRLPLAVEALVARDDAPDGAVLDEQLLRGRLGQHHPPSSSACSARWRPSCASEKIQLPLLWKGGGVGSRTAYPGRIR